MGLYEGMLGNSGAAISDTTAASFYNPSLLSKKKANSYSLSANSFGSVKSKNQDTEYSSLTLNPAYLSTVIVGSYLVHEIFFYSTTPSKLNYITKTTTAEFSNSTETQSDNNQINFGYSMAFQTIPFALSYFAEYLQFKSFSFAESNSNTSILKSTTASKSELTSFGLGVSASGHFTIDNYTFGANFKSRRLTIYKKRTGSGTIYSYGAAGATDYKKELLETDSANTMPTFFGNSIIIGHGFKIGDHEFLTDTNLDEESELNYRFRATQTFGYRMNSDFGHQFLCGISHLINSDIRYFGQSAYYSTGYSWLTRTQRSTIGLYYYSSRLEQEISAVGLTFGSEFNY